MISPSGERLSLEQFISGAYLEDQVSAVLTERLSEDFRLDSEHYKPEYLRVEDLLSDLNAKKWHEFDGDFIVGPFGSAFTVDRYVDESPYRYIRGKDVKPFFLLDDDNAYMPRDDYERLNKYALQQDDVLVSVVGTLGNAALVNEQIENAIFSCKSTAYRSYSIDPHYLTAYLNSSIGQAFLQRNARGAIQLGLNLPDLRNIPIYLPTTNEQTQISDMVRESWRKLTLSKALYEEAEGLLLEALGLGALDLRPQLSYTASFDEAGLDFRLDAEFFQPKFERTYEAIRRLNPLKIQPLGELLDLVTNGHTPRRHDLSVGEVTFLTAEHVLDFQIDYESHKRIELIHHEGLLTRTQLQDGDVLMTIKGRVGNVAIVEDLERPTNINQDVALLRLKNGYDPYYIMGFLNSIVGKTLVEKASTGQINPFLRLGSLQRIPIPIFEKERMDELGEEVKSTVHRASRAQFDANQLLETAKQRVEQMILGEDATQ